MYFIDGHCDVLWKMWKEPGRHSFYDPYSELDASYTKLRTGGVRTQVFAIFVPSNILPVDRFRVAYHQANLFYEQILQKGEKIQLITDGKQLSNLSANKLGAILVLEGLDCMQGEIEKLHLFYHLGVRQVGLTWNYANEVADGVLERRNAGLSEFGHQVMEEIRRLQMIVDVSHLSENSFWDVIEYEDVPVLASHSNAQRICPHPRNLTDEQILALLRRDGRIGITFVPEFVSTKTPTIEDVRRHIEYICELGGESNLFFGSDFDGIESKIPGLEGSDSYLQLYEYLTKYYSIDLIEKWAHQNMESFYRKNLKRC